MGSIVCPDSSWGLPRRRQSPNSPAPPAALIVEIIFFNALGALRLRARTIHARYGETSVADRPCSDQRRRAPPSATGLLRGSAARVRRRCRRPGRPAGRFFTGSAGRGLASGGACWLSGGVGRTRGVRLTGRIGLLLLFHRVETRIVGARVAARLTGGPQGSRGVGAAGIRRAADRPRPAACRRARPPCQRRLPAGRPGPGPAAGQTDGAWGRAGRADAGDVLIRDRHRDFSKRRLSRTVVANESRRGRQRRSAVRAEQPATRKTERRADSDCRSAHPG